MKQLLAATVLLLTAAATLSANDDNRSTSSDNSMAMNEATVEAIVRHPFWRGAPAPGITKNDVVRMLGIMTREIKDPRNRVFAVAENGQTGSEASGYQKVFGGRFILIKQKAENRAMALRLLRNALDEAMSQRPVRITYPPARVTP